MDFGLTINDNYPDLYKKLREKFDIDYIEYSQNPNRNS